jgi:hypothetical protein
MEDKEYLERITIATEKIAYELEEKAERRRKKERDRPRLGDSHNEIRRRWGTL